MNKSTKITLVWMTAVLLTGLSSSSALALGRGSVCFSDDPIQSGTTVIRASHINEMHTAFDNATCCGDGVAQTGAGEECDGSDFAGKTDCISLGGYTGGTLACGSNCHFDTSGCINPANCGNGIINAGEVCDTNNLNGQTCSSKGFYTGTLSCNSNCTFNTSLCTDCGNGLINGNEQCDTNNNLNGKDCTNYVSGSTYTGGTLQCNASCNFDTSQCCTKVNGVWGSWGACSASCGGGTQTRTCSTPSCGGSECTRTDGTLTTPSDRTESQECNTQSCGPVCGDGTCDSGENCSTCPGDCICSSGKSCCQGACVTPSCGDGCCNGTETQLMCCRDCGCSNSPSGWQCIFIYYPDADYGCMLPPVCGDGTCDAFLGENSSNCCSDCPANCSSGQHSVCRPIGGAICEETTEPGCNDCHPHCNTDGCSYWAGCWCGGGYESDPCHDKPGSTVNCDGLACSCP